jgi:hypothetical protein
MPDHHLAFADIMAELLAQSPDKPNDPPVEKSVLEDKTDLVLQSLIGEAAPSPGVASSAVLVDEIVKPDVSAATAVVAELTKAETVVPEVVVQEAASTPKSGGIVDVGGFHAAVARFKAMKRGS